MTAFADGLPHLADVTADQFGAWVTPHLRAMTLLAVRLTGPADGDDVVQEALARAWLKRASFDPARGTAAAWLLAITADRARRHRVRRRSLPAIPIGSPRSREEDLDLEVAVARLSGRQRLAVDCYYFVGLSVAETAAVMRCSEGTVKSTLSDARARLRALLEVPDGPA